MLKVAVWHVPKLRVWHSLFFVAAIACGLAIYRIYFDHFSPQSILRHARSADPQERLAALNQVSEVWVSDEGFGLLLGATEDEDPKVRAGAAWILAVAVQRLRDDKPAGSKQTLGPRWVASSVDRLRNLLRDPDGHARLNAAFGLNRLGERSEEVAARLREGATTKSLDQTSQQNALAALAVDYQERPETLAMMLAMAKDQDHAYRSRAMMRFCHWRVESGVPPAILEALGSGLDDRDPNVRSAAITSLDRFGRWARPYIPALTRALKDGDGEVRLHSALALGRHGIDAEGALLTLRLLASDPEKGVREAAAASVTAIEGSSRQFREQLLPSLIADLSSADPEARRTSARVLGRYGASAKSASPGLVRLLSDAEASVRRAAVAALAGVGGGDGVAEALDRAASRDSDALVRAAAAAASEALSRSTSAPPPR